MAKMNDMIDVSYDELFAAEFHRLVGRNPSYAEITERDRRRGIYTIREIIDMLQANSLPIV